MEKPVKTRERTDASGFPIEKTTPKCRLTGVLRVLLNFCHRPTVRFGLRRDPRGRFREPRFASFLAQTNRGRVDTDRHDALLRGRKLMRNLFRLAVGGGCAWVLLESAKALSVF